MYCVFEILSYRLLAMPFLFTHVIADIANSICKQIFGNMYCLMNLIVEKRDDSIKDSTSFSVHRKKSFHHSYVIHLSLVFDFEVYRFIKYCDVRVCIILKSLSKYSGQMKSAI